MFSRKPSVKLFQYIRGIASEDYLGSVGPSVSRLSVTLDHAVRDNGLLLHEVTFVNGPAIGDVLPFRSSSGLHFPQYLLTPSFTCSFFREAWSQPSAAAAAMVRLWGCLLFDFKILALPVYCGSGGLSFGRLVSLQLYQFCLQLLLLLSESWCMNLQ